MQLYKYKDKAIAKITGLTQMSQIKYYFIVTKVYTDDAFSFPEAVVQRGVL